MECRTSFTVPHDCTEVHHKDVGCKTTLEFINNIPTPYEYLSKVEIVRKGRFLSETNSYELLSYAQFECLLKCASEKKTLWQHQACQKPCLEELVKYVTLSPKDQIIYGKHPPA